MQATLAAGTTLKSTVTLSDYPASEGWALAYRLAPRGGGPAITAIDISTTASDDDYLVNVPKATTAAWVADTYTVTAWVDDGTDRFPVPSECGEITVTPNPATLPVGIDTRSSAAIALEAVQAVLLGKATSGTMEYQINGRQLRSYPLPDLMRLEAKLKADVDRELIAAGKDPVHGAGRPRTIWTRFA